MKKILIVLLLIGLAVVCTWKGEEKVTQDEIVQIEKNMKSYLMDTNE